MKNRVVITGIGVVTPVGVGKDAFWNNLIGGVSGISTVTRFDVTDYPTKIAGEVKDFDPYDYLDKKDARRMDRFAQFAVAASALALEDSGIDLNHGGLDRIGVTIGTGIGGTESFEEQHTVLLEKGPGRVSPFFVPMMIGNMGAGQVSIQFGLRGPNVTIVNACAASANSVGEAFRLLQYGKADVMVTGGAEAAVSPMSMAGFNAMRAMSVNNEFPEKASRPFDLNRDGFVMSEGSGIMVLETLEHAEARGAHIYAEVVGYGCTADAYHITSPSPDGEGARKSMAEAISDAGISPQKVNYINAHGTSTQLNDQYETLAIKNLFGDHAKSLAISSTKSMTGHLLGASGAVEVIASALAIENGIIPPTINYETPDPECDLDYVPNHSRQQAVDVALSNSFGFGGHNVTIALRKFE